MPTTYPNRRPDPEPKRPLVCVTCQKRMRQQFKRMYYCGQLCMLRDIWRLTHELSAWLETDYHPDPRQEQDYPYVLVFAWYDPANGFRPVESRPKTGLRISPRRRRMVRG